MSGTLNNINNIEALQKISEIVKHARTTMMLTALEKRPISARPMGIQSI